MIQPVSTSAPSSPGEGQGAWPDHIDLEAATLLFDTRWIGYLDGLPHQRVQAWQSSRLAQLLAHAAEQSTWWRERLGGLAGRPIKLADLPIMSRHEYRESIETTGGPLRLPGGHGQAIENQTSGSSGIPVRFYSSSLAQRLARAEWYYDNIRQARDPGLLRAELAGRVPHHSGPHSVVKESPLLGLGKMLQRRLTLFTIEENAKWLSEVRPGYLNTFTSALSGLLDVYESGSVEPPRIEQVTTFGETVDASLRRRTRAVLGASIRDRYSCEEVGPIAFQCPEHEEFYHLASSNAIVEVLNDADRPCQDDVVGRLIVTSLHNFASPVIRYELNDLAASRSRCPCGREAPVLTQLLGRKRFLVRLPSGERTALRFGAKEWLAIAPIREHRVVQVSEGVIHAELVLDRPLTEAERQAVVAMLHKEVSPDLTYEVRQVDRIDWAQTYKRQDFVSLV